MSDSMRFEEMIVWKKTKFYSIDASKSNLSRHISFFLTRIVASNLNIVMLRQYCILMQAPCLYAKYIRNLVQQDLEYIWFSVLTSWKVKSWTNLLLRLVPQFMKPLWYIMRSQWSLLLNQWIDPKKSWELKSNPGSSYKIFVGKILTNKTNWFDQVYNDLIDRAETNPNTVRST